MITIVGVGHVFDIGDQVRSVILQRNPSVVCVELDRGRYEALMAKDVRGSAPPVYRAMALFQRWIAKKYGQDVGQEMVAAIESAKEVGAKIAFIDLDSLLIFQRFWGLMSFKEKVKLGVALLSSIFVPRKKVDKEISKFEENEQMYIEQFGKEFPAAKKILIDDRNTYMANAIGQLNEQFGSLVAVVGDGHVDGLSQLLGDKELEIIRLKDLRSMEVDSSSVSFSYDVRSG
ncbi:MAG: TraB/GumN family protein [Methanobacteriota archaeon]|nr:MAG: TraB/GumN family protein [Euryarchaeota archaeon]